MVDPRMLLLTFVLVTIGVISVSVKIVQFLLKRHWPDTSSRIGAGGNPIRENKKELKPEK